jgi:site-specific DNA-methyltransferase (adenine-specific)/adenine-specific DNA-methyltransferase
MGRADVFDNPKPTRLIRRLLQLATDKDSIVLDAFPGSGTTGHAVMQLNKEDGGNRRFILVEIDANICRNVTAERLRRVCQGYKKGDGTAIEGLGGGFRFSVLGDPLFDERGNIRKTVRFPDLARHVYFVETGEPLPCQAHANSPLVGICRGTAIYLLYNGILKDKSPDGGNVLTTAVLAALPEHDGPRVIYGTACRLGPERLRREGFVFKQLPYKLRVDAP